jgi:hypothetical protein
VDGQGQIQRAAWAAHGGIELGTEGDSFYVVFPTAEVGGEGRPGYVTPDKTALPTK